MTESPPLVAILRLCAATVPWFPKNAAANLGLTEDDLMAFVEQLRDGGLVVRTDPVPGFGRGYVLTPAGTQALQDPGQLEWLRRGHVPPPQATSADGAPPAAVPQRERAVRMSLLAPFTPYVVRALIAANVAVFVWGVSIGQRRGLKFEHFVSLTPPNIARETGAVSAEDLLAPGPGLVRLLTCCFVHFGLIHLAANMISLYFVGPLLERMWGHVRFLVLYLIAGFGGSCAAMVLRPAGGAATLAGASGALWGVMASLAVWIVLNRRYMPRRLLASWGRSIVLVLIINVALTYQLSHIISSEAHYGGGLVGAACAVLLHLTRFGPMAVRALAAVAVAALPVFGLWAVTHPGRFNPEWDRIELRERGLADVDRAEAEARDLLKRSPADLLLLQGPTRRNAQWVKEVVSKYEEACDLLRPAADQLRSAGPFRDAEAEEVRAVRLALIEAKLDLWARQERCLKDGENWPGKDPKNRELAERVKELEQQRKELPALK